MVDDTGVHWLHVFIDVPAADGPAMRAFWSRALGWPPGAQWSEHPEFVTLVPPSGSDYVHVQDVDDDPRVHLDVVVDDVNRARDRLSALGAGVHLRMPWWQVMSSPGGLPFCLCPERRPPTRPASTEWPDGHRSRLVQVCLDVPDNLYEREVDFWQQLTGWRRRPGRHAEFEGLDGPAEAPVRLLVQRLGPDDPGTATRAHIDLGTDDVDAEAARLTSSGARHVERVRSWVVLRDPAGLPFCVTTQPPG